MLIDWFTVGAQVVNFLILVWLLKRFLYKPILDAIDAREKRIADQLAGADAKKKEAQKEKDDFSNKNKVFDEQRSALFSKAEADSKAERDGLLNTARKDADDLREAQASALKEDKVRLGSEITRLTGEEVIRIARKALKDLATASLEERIEEVFMQRFHEMQGDSQRLMGEALKSSSEPAVLRSSFELSAVQKEAIQKALNESFSAEIRVRFEVSEALICGIELTGNGQKLDWNIATYLSSLDRSLSKLLDSQTQRKSGTDVESEAHSETQQSANATVIAGAK